MIDDYGHHPTEIRATLAAARQCGFRRVHVIFQPHRFTRTRDLMDEFTTAFADADTLSVLDIYPASEKPIEGITAEALVSRIAGAGKRASRMLLHSPTPLPGCRARSTGGHGDDPRRGERSQLGAMILERLEEPKAKSQKLTANSQPPNQVDTVSNCETEL